MTRIVRQLSLLAMLLAAMLSPSPRVHCASARADYAIVSRVHHTPHVALATLYKVVVAGSSLASTRDAVLSAALPSLYRSDKILLPTVSYRKAAHTSCGRLYTFQLPPPYLQA
jgi:hypothetical protein